MTEQLDLILALAGGQIKPRAMLPVARGTAASRLLQLTASAVGFAQSFVSPSMAVVGDTLSWGVGDIRLLPSINGRTFLRELLHGRPVIFVQRADASPYDSLTKYLNFDCLSHSQTLLNGNDCLALCGYSKGRKVFAHVGKSEHGQSAVQRHYEGLTTARAALMHTSLIRTIATPEPIHGNSEAIAFSQSCLEGQKIDLRKTQPEEFNALLECASRPLLEMHAETARQDGIPEQRFIQRMKSDLVKVGPDETVKAGIEEVISDVETWLMARRPGTVCVHGDYTFSNLLFDDDKKVSAIVDWEWTRGNGCPGYDAMHLGLAAASAQFGIAVPTLAANLVRHSDVPKALEHYFSSMLPKLGLTLADVAPLAKLTWLGTIFRSSVWTPSTYKDWLARASAPMLQALKGGL